MSVYQIRRSGARVSSPDSQNGSFVNASHELTSFDTPCAARFRRRHVLAVARISIAAVTSPQPTTHDTEFFTEELTHLPWNDWLTYLSPIVPYPSITISHVLTNYEEGLARALTKSCRNRAAGAPSTIR